MVVSKGGEKIIPKNEATASSYPIAGRSLWSEMNARLFQLALSALYLLFVVNGKENGPIVTLPNKIQLQGKNMPEGGAVSYRGIRYASPPVGALRWAPPRPYTPTDADLAAPVDATHYGQVCPQHPASMCMDQGCSEDCLYLNVFTGIDAVRNSTTTSSDAELLPVAIYVHGGAYKSGSSNLYPAGELVKYWKGKAIVVSLNYRLGVLGFLGSRDLRELDQSDGSTGNQGIQDQRLAFQWVQDNIAAFGGDKSRVMIFGESAGAGSMSMHLTMPKSFGLYNRVILESGSFAQWTMRPMTHAQEIYDSIVAQTTCTDTTQSVSATLACLQALTVAELDAAVSAVHPGGIDQNLKYEPFAPTADGVEAITHPWLLAKAGKVNNVPIMQGTNTDEGSMFCSLSRDASQQDLNDYWTACQVDNAVDRARLQDIYVTSRTGSDAYPVVQGNGVYWWAGERSLGDTIMSCPAKYVGQTLSSQGHEDLYTYHFEHVAKYEESKRYEANRGLVTHASELPFVFHFETLLLKYADRKMADVMATYWGNFLISEKGNPNEKHVGDKHLPTWPTYHADSDQVLAMPDRQGINVKVGLKKEECDYWIPFIESSITKDFRAV